MTAPAVLSFGDSAGLVLGIIAGFCLVFPLFWCAVVLLISRLGDWHRLSKTYAAGSRQPSGTGAVHSGVFGLVGISRYKFTLTVHFERDGFFLENMFLFRVGHPRLFIPWSAIAERSSRDLWRWKVTVLTIGQPREGKIALALPETLFQPPLPGAAAVTTFPQT